ncbi:MAG TPA: polyamine aminopropyltransferase [Pseudomonadales bacterium]
MTKQASPSKQTANTEDSPSWFTEKFTSEGSSFGLQLKTLLHKEQSPFQTIEIFDTSHFGRLMVLDACIMLSQRDNFLYHEMMTHPALLSHPQPKTVAIIGGGDCGTLKEVLKHKSVTAVTQVELDERVTEVAKQYFPELCESNDDPRASLLFTDGIEWIKSCKPGSLDILIIDSTDPVGPAAGLFSEAFYQYCFSALAEGGMLVQQSESPLYHTHSIIAGMKNDLTSAGFSHPLLRTFPQPVYPSGWWSCLLVSKSSNQAASEVHRQKRSADFKTQYYNDEIHDASACLPEFMK